MDDDALLAIDAALLRMRRLWLSPASKAQLERDVGEGVELSSVLVVDAIARGGTGGEVSVADVAERLSVERSTGSRLVEGAVRAGFVERQASQADARRTALRLTAEGRALLQRAKDFRRAHLARLLEGWSPGDREAFARLLARFARAVAEVEPGSDEPPLAP